MSDLKEFLEKKSWYVESDRTGSYEGQYPLSITLDELFVFLWEEDEVQAYLLWCDNNKFDFFDETNRYFMPTGYKLFKYCVDIDEELVKQRIKDLKQKGEL